MKIIVSEIFLDALHDIAAGQQRFHFPGDAAARIVDERADVIVSETKLFVPVKMLSLAIFKHPVITAKWSDGLSFSAVLSMVFIISSI